MSGPGDAEREARIEEGWDLLEEGQADAALDAAEALVAEDPGNTEARLLAGSAAMALDDPVAAERHLIAALKTDPGDVDARVALADARFALCRFAESLELVRGLERDAPDDARVRWLAALHAERRGEIELADREERAASRLDPEAFPLPPRMTRERFATIVDGAMQELPDLFRERLENLALFVDPVPSEHVLASLDEPAPDLLGLYVGIPATERSFDAPAPAPEAIYLFQRNLERAAADEGHLSEEIRITLLHEIGHYLGMDEDDLAEAGYD